MTPSDILLLAHRGHHVGVPENTLAAFEAAVKLGVDGIETDVSLSADGELVLLHDRVTPQGRPVAETTRAALAKDFGYHVPMLADALEAFPDVLWNIEIKTPAATAAALTVLARYRNSRRLLVTSFWHNVVIQCADQLAVAGGLLLAHRPLDVAMIIAGCARCPGITCLVWDYNVVDDEVLGTVNAAGWHNYVYGTVTAAEHEHCHTLRCAGVITDFPLRMSSGRPPSRNGTSAMA